ncbi:hypothetical protein [Polyangium sorediatum]|uniref:Uncharacterized protein n=1 Tax=Polyangium sorediatum TaxID=889274 RepID=A0ABT6NL44_9BACT|nr:hypothetical protein [Polyangium sorediatum]MDI1429031.1 hypothetical protein [Polyangium sorediatum]
MATMAMPAVGPAQLALVKNQAEMAQVRREASAIKKENAALKADLAVLSRGVRDRVGSGLSSAITAGAAFGAGVADGYLEAKGSDKVGPFKLVSVAGLGLALAGVWLDDPDFAEGASALARGLAAGPLYVSGRDNGRKMAQRGQTAQQPGLTTTAPARV